MSYMINTPIPDTYARLSPNATTVRRVADALTQLGDGWHSLRAIVQAIGVTRASDPVRAVLAKWAAEGLLETRQVQTEARAHIARTEYRVIGDLSAAVAAKTRPPAGK